MRLFNYIPAAFLLLSGAMFIPHQVWAVPAAPVQHELRQADGSLFPARQWGDEYSAGWESVDGYTILFEQESGNWTYANHDRDGNLVSSGRRVGRDLPPGQLHRKLRPKKSQKLDLFRATSLPSASPPVGTLQETTFPAAASSPAAETRNIPVILINFNDTATSYTPAAFENLLFSPGTWSMKNYYEEVSSGSFSVASGPSGVSAWGTAVGSHDYYGQPSGWGPPDAWPGDLAYEAVQQADPYFNFAPYDIDGDCSVDLVAIVHQGPGQEASANTTDIWSHSWSLSSTYYFGLNHYGPAYTTNDPCVTNPARFVTINDYIMQPETFLGNLTTVGVFTHEYGHALGLPDLYDTDDSSEGVGNWSLMASGSWGGVTRPGDRPVHLDPWSKAQLGWISPVRVTAAQTGKQIAAVETSAEVSQFLNTLAEGGSGEYYLLENRQKTGFDAAMPGAGLLLWHIDEREVDNNSEWYPDCTDCTAHFKVALVAADNQYQLEKGINRGDSGDPFPGSAGNRAFSFWTAPAAAFYNGLTAGFSLNAISDSAAVMTVDVTPPDLTPPVTTITAAPAAFSGTGSGSFSFSASESATFVCSLDGSPAAACTSPFLFSGLADGNHSFTVRATDQAGNRETTLPGLSWTIDTLTPNTFITASPANPANTGKATFSFTASETGVSFACSLDSSDFAPCTTPAVFSGLSDGNHNFKVRAVDQAGNTDATPANFDWTVYPCPVSLSGTCHAGLSAAYAAIPEGTAVTLLVRAETFIDELIADRDVVATLKGGYDDAFAILTGMGELQGAITVKSGVIIAAGITIR